MTWQQSGAATVRATIASSQTDPGTPVTHNLIVLITNATPDTWTGFEVAIGGPATIAPLPPAFLNLGALSLPVTAHDNTVSVTGLNWEGLGGTTSSFGQLAFNLDISPPTANEQLVLTFTPIAEVPEPASALLLTVGGLILARRRSRP